jgi:hypothetical protein
MMPSHAAATPSVARNAGIAAVAISCDQSLKSEASPTPRTVRLSHGAFFTVTVLAVAADG